MMLSNSFAPPPYPGGMPSPAQLMAQVDVAAAAAAAAAAANAVGAHGSSKKRKTTERTDAKTSHPPLNVFDSGSGRAQRAAAASAHASMVAQQAEYDALLDQEEDDEAEELERRRKKKDKAAKAEADAELELVDDEE